MPEETSRLSHPHTTLRLMHHTRTLHPDSPPAEWDYARRTLDEEAAIAWPGAVCVGERIEPAHDELILIVREYQVPE